MGVPDHLTARLVLDLMRIAGGRGTAASSPPNDTSTNTGNVDIQQRAQNLRYSIMAEASSSGPESSSCSERSLTTASSSAHNSINTSFAHTSIANSSWTEDESIAKTGASWASEQGDEAEEPPRSRCDASLFDDDVSEIDGSEIDEADQSRAAATAEATKQDSWTSLPAPTATADDNTTRNPAPSQTCQQDVQLPYHICNDVLSALNEVSDHGLTGALSALHEFMASGGDPAVLEKAYDLARSVAGSKNDVKVAFDACRIALAAGYVHSLQKSAPELAHKLALHHTLPRLAQSLKMYWSRQSEWSTLAQELQWDECMLSLLEYSWEQEGFPRSLLDLVVCEFVRQNLESQLRYDTDVISSIYLMTGVEDIVSFLDAEVDAGVAESIGRYCVLNSEVLSEYPHVGNACALRHLRASSIPRNSHQRELSVHSE